MSPPGYHHNDFVVTNALGNMVYDLTVWHIFVDREGTLFSWLHINYAHLASVRFCVSWITYDH